MAIRPIFFSSYKQGSLLETREVDFKWHPGLSISQKQESIAFPGFELAHRKSQNAMRVCDLRYLFLKNITFCDALFPKLYIIS